MAEFVLHVHDIDQDGKQHDFPLTASWVDAALAESGMRADREAGEGELSVFVQKTGRDILVNGQVHASLIVPCNRCLGDAKVDVEAQLVSLLSPKPDERRAEPEELELAAEDLDREYYEGDDVVLDELVREQLLLEVPMQPLCREDCPGIPIPAHIRGDVAVNAPSEGDPRFAKVRALARKQSGS